MTLIKSISGIRGTIGGRPGDNLTPVDAVKFAAAYGTWLKNSTSESKTTVVIGRDARISGPMVQQLVVSTLSGLGIDVIDLGLSTTPTVEIAVPLEKADGGIILTASHNPKQWNALKLLNEKGEFLDGEQGAKILRIAEAEDFDFAGVDDLGQVTIKENYIDIHIEEVLKLDLVNPEPIHKQGFKVVVDGVNSTGGMFGEEYTLVACADYVLGKTPGNTVSNLSSSRALRDVTVQHGAKYEAAAVGEVNVVAKMKSTDAVIGGEGNGGIIYPESHYGRDSLVGTALFLMLLTERGGKVSELRNSYPSYFMSKKKIALTPDLNVDELLEEMAQSYSNEEVSTIDGVKIDFETSWVHLRKSNTEPIIRIYTEAKSQEEADSLADRIIAEIKQTAGIS